MQQKFSTRVAWLFSAMGDGGISFQHLLCEFAQVFPNTIAFTGQWPGYARGFENTFTIEEVGAARYVRLAEAENGYAIGFSYASPQIVGRLLKFQPRAIFTNAFTAWTLLALLLKPVGRWKVIIIYEGGSSTYESPSSTIRYQARRLMVSLADAFVVNSKAGETYLTNVLKAKSEKVSSRPFLIPSRKALLQGSDSEVPQLDSSLKRPIFLFVGQIIPRKGLKTLLEACLILNQQAYKNYTMMIVGDGEQRSELELFVQQSDLEDQVAWMGKIPYHLLGAYFQFADVIVFPTYDDIWGMVVTEAMAFGKPVICSSEAGASEMITEQQNGFLFDPGNSELLAKLMRHFLDNSTMIQSMGNNSLATMAGHTPKHAISGFTEALKISRIMPE